MKSKRYQKGMYLMLENIILKKLADFHRYRQLTNIVAINRCGSQYRNLLTFRIQIRYFHYTTIYPI